MREPGISTVGICGEALRGVELPSGERLILPNFNMEARLRAGKMVADLIRQNSGTDPQIVVSGGNTRGTPESNSAYYADFMEKYLDVPALRISQVSTSLNTIADISGMLNFVQDPAELMVVSSGWHETARTFAEKKGAHFTSVEDVIALYGHQTMEEMKRLTSEVSVTSRRVLEQKIGVTLINLGLEGIYTWAANKTISARTRSTQKR